MMKHYKILIISLLFLFLNSCTKDFLDVNNTQNLYRESYVKDLTSMQDYLNGTYVLLGSKFEAKITATYPELSADNIRPASVTSPTSMFAHYNWVQMANGINGMDELWVTGYTIIRACNFTIETVDKYRAENAAQADNIKGQALSIRAYVFFRLVNTFAQPYKYTTEASHPGVPYITTSDITKPYSRQTVSEVYNGMISDLISATQILPPAIADIRYMNRNAAKALLARVYLFKEDFANAKVMAAEIVNLVPLMTITAGYPDNMFKFKSPTQTETLFQLSPSPGGSLNRTDFISRYLRRSPIQFVATNDVANILKENMNDVRQAWVTNNSNQWNVTKFPKGVAPEVTPAITIQEIAYYPAIIRSSEMFLTVAEASAKTGDENTARFHLDAVRKRADPTIPTVTATGAALLDSIYKERRKEFAFEGFRMFDLQRWKQAINRIDVLPGSPASLPYPNEKAISPIPTSDVKLAGIAQNQGY